MDTVWYMFHHVSRICLGGLNRNHLLFIRCFRHCIYNLQLPGGFSQLFARFPVPAIHRFTEGIEDRQIDQGHKDCPVLKTQEALGTNSEESTGFRQLQAKTPLQSWPPPSSTCQPQGCWLKYWDVDNLYIYVYILRSLRDTWPWILLYTIWKEFV